MKKIVLIILSLSLFCFLGCGKKSPLSIANEKTVGKSNISLVEERPGMIIKEDFQNCTEGDTYLPYSFMDTGAVVWEIVKKGTDDLCASQTAISEPIINAYWDGQGTWDENVKDYTVEARMQIEELNPIEYEGRSASGITARYDQGFGAFWVLYFGYLDTDPGDNLGYTTPGVYINLNVRIQDPGDYFCLGRAKLTGEDTHNPEKWYVGVLQVTGYNPTELIIAAFADGTDPSKITDGELETEALAVLRYNNTSAYTLESGNPGMRVYHTKFAYSYFYVYKPLWIGSGPSVDKNELF